MLGLNSYLLAGGLAASVVAGGAGYMKGRADGNAVGERRVQAMLVAAQRAKDAEALQGSQASTALETKTAAARVVYRTITRDVNKIVERPVYRLVCFDSDGLALANAALAGVEVVLPPRPLPARPTP